MSPRPAIAFALSLAAMPACAESGQEWLARMTAALNNASYVGEFISEFLPLLVASMLAPTLA